MPKTAFSIVTNSCSEIYDGIDFIKKMIYICSFSWVVNLWGSASNNQGFIIWTTIESGILPNDTLEISRNSIYSWISLRVDVFEFIINVYSKFDAYYDSKSAFSSILLFYESISFLLLFSYYPFIVELSISAMIYD